MMVSLVSFDEYKAIMQSQIYEQLCYLKLYLQTRMF